MTKEVLPTLQRAWAKLAPSIVAPSAAKKKTKAVIEFVIQKDGSLGEMKLKESSNDTTLDTAVLNSFKAATPFHALPSQFKGESLDLQFALSFNPESGSK